jgi:hypothetical protein
VASAQHMWGCLLVLLATGDEANVSRRAQHVFCCTHSDGSCWAPAAPAVAVWPQSQDPSALNTMPEVMMVSMWSHPASGRALLVKSCAAKLRRPMVSLECCTAKFRTGLLPGVRGRSVKVCLLQPNRGTGAQT